MLMNAAVVNMFWQQQQCQNETKTWHDTDEQWPCCMQTATLIIRQDQQHRRYYLYHVGRTDRSWNQGSAL
jgi:hypothetical protein